MNTAESELGFAIAFLIDAHADLADQIMRVKREGITWTAACTAHRDLLHVQEQTIAAVADLALLVQEAEMEKLPNAR